MTWPLYQVDAFCAEPFAGNPAAVCLLEGDEDAGWMQAVAAEMNLSEKAAGPGTAAPRPEPGSGGYDFVSRYFAPAAGIDEDPVTGSAHCTLGPFRAERLGRDQLTGSRRPGGAAWSGSGPRATGSCSAGGRSRSFAVSSSDLRAQVVGLGTSRRARTAGWAVDQPAGPNGRLGCGRPAASTCRLGYPPGWGPITGLGPRTGGLTEEAAWGTV